MTEIQIAIRKNDSRKFVWFFKDAGLASHFMLARSLTSYTLLINGREYPWVEKNIFIASFSFTDVVQDHIEECVELEKAFYG